MKKVSLPQLRRYVESLGGTVTEGDVHGFEVSIDSPPRKVWKSDGLHCLVEACFDHRERATVLFYAMERVVMGLEDCTDDNCEYCLA